MINKTKFIPKRTYKKLIKFKELFYNNQKLLNLKKLYELRLLNGKINVKYVPTENNLKINTYIPGRQNLKQENYCNFKKKKWQRLLFYLLKINKTNKSYYKFFDQSIYTIPRFTNVFLKKFKENLILKQQIKISYGYLKQKQFKKLQILHKQNLNLMKNLEKRLDIVLARSNFVLTIKNAQQLIAHGHVLVNDTIIKKKSFLLKKGDKITITPKSHKLIEYYILKSMFKPSIPKYLQINYKIFQIMIIEDEFSNNSNFFG